MTFKGTVLPRVVMVVVLPALASCGCGAAEPPEQVEAALELDRAARGSIQRGLRAEGFDAGVADGVFGPRTRAAIRGWQQSRGTSASGFLDGSEAEALRVAGAGGGAAFGAAGASTSPVAEGPVASAPAAGGAAPTESPGAGVAGAEPAPQGDLTDWVRAVDASMTGAERAAEEAAAGAAGAGGWFSRLSACLDAEARMTSALDRVASLTVGEERPAVVAPPTGNAVYAELGERMTAARERARAACGSVEPPR